MRKTSKFMKLQNLNNEDIHTYLQYQNRVVDALVDERIKQTEKWGIQRHPYGVWASILGEEVGEVCQAVNGAHFPSDAKPTDAQNLYEELIQVAAVAVSWAEQLLEEEEGK